MKNKGVVKRYIFGLVLGLSLAAVAPAALANNHYFIQMKVKNGSELDIRTNKKETGDCRGMSKKKGCVRVPVDDRNLKVSFLLAGNSKCKRANGAKWKLSGVTLGGKGSSKKPASWGGFERDQEVKKDFVFLDAGKGTLQPSSASSDRIFTISDKNQSTYTVWYKVEAICVDARGTTFGAPIFSDPRIENTGTTGR